MERARTFVDEAAAVVRHLMGGTHFSLTGGGLEPYFGWVFTRCMQEYGRTALANSIHDTIRGGMTAPAGHAAAYSDAIIQACSRPANTTVLDALENKFKTYPLPRFTYYSRPVTAAPHSRPDKKNGAGSGYGEWVVEASSGAITVRAAAAIEGWRESGGCRESDREGGLKRESRREDGLKRESGSEGGLKRESRSEGGLKRESGSEQNDLMDLRVDARFLGYECDGKIPRLLLEGRHNEFAEKIAACKTVREVVGFLITIISDI